MSDLGVKVNGQKVSEYDKEMPQSHTADKSTVPWGRAKEHF